MPMKIPPIRLKYIVCFAKFPQVDDNDDDVDDVIGRKKIIRRNEVDGLADSVDDGFVVGSTRGLFDEADALLDYANDVAGRK